MKNERKLKTGILVKARASKDATPEEQVYLLAKDHMAYVDSDGSVSYKMRPASDDMLAPILTIEDTQVFIRRCLNFAGVDLVTKGRLEGEIMTSLKEIRDSYYEPSLAEKMYNESPRKSSSWVPWEKLDDAEAAGWKKAAEMKEAYDKLLESSGMKMMDVSPPVKGPDYNVGGVVKRPVKDTPQA